MYCKPIYKVNHPTLPGGALLKVLIQLYTPSSPCFRTGHSGWGGKIENSG